MDINLFSYRYDKTLIHKIPALLKIIFLCFISIRLFSSKINSLNINAWIQCCFYFIINCILFIISKTKFSSLKKLSYIPILGIIIILIIGLDFNPIRINFSKSLEALLYVTRLFIISFLALIIFDTTSTYQIEKELDKIPLFKRFKISQTISLTILFIPLIFRLWNKINLASKARICNKKNYTKNIVFNLFQSFSTLFSCLLESAENTRKAILNRNKIN